MGRDEELMEQRKDLFEELSLYKNDVVIVEGRRDLEALEERGFIHVVTINQMGGLQETAESVCKMIGNNQEILLLMDFDPEGERLAKKLRVHIRGLGCRTDDRGRRELRRRFLENKLTTIEGLMRLERRHLMES